MTTPIKKKNMKALLYTPKIANLYNTCVVIDV